MSENHQALADRIDQLLIDADSVLESESAPEGEPEQEISLEDSDALTSLSADAEDLIEHSESHELLEAVGFSGQSTVPGAIANGEPVAVARLRALLKLSKLPVQEPGSAGTAVEIQESLQVVQESVDEWREESESESNDEAERDESKRGHEDKSAVDDTDTAGENGGGDETAESDDSGTVETVLRSAMTSALESFGDDLTSVQERLEGMGEEGDDSSERLEGEAEGEADDGERDSDETDDDDEDGILEGITEADSDDGEDRPRRSTMYSTMPSSDRGDMGSNARLSTVAGRSRYSTMPK